MVDERTGVWYPEKNYSTYPKEKWCDCDRLCVAIRKDGYVPKTSMNNLVNMVFAYYMEDFESVDDVVQEVYASGGWKEFDYEC